MVRRHLFSCLLFLLFILMQTTLVPRLGGILEQADLILVLTVAYALVMGPSEGAAVGLVTGLLRGVVSGPTLGIYAVALYIIGYSVGQFSRLMYRKSVLVPLVVGMVATAGYWLLMTVLVGGFYGFWIGGGYWLGLPSSILLNGVLTAFLYGLLYNRQQRELARGRG